MNFLSTFLHPFPERGQMIAADLRFLDKHDLRSHHSQGRASVTAVIAPDAVTFQPHDDALRAFLGPFAPLALLAGCPDVPAGG